MTEGKKALLVMGCPEVPVQMSMVIYLTHKLNKCRLGCDRGRNGCRSQAAQGRRSGELLCAKDGRSGPAHRRVVEKKIDFDVCFAFMHSDAGMTYGATFSAISKAKLYAVVFGKNAEALGESIDYPAEKIVAKATHNPNPLKNKIDKVVL